MSHLVITFLIWVVCSQAMSSLAKQDLEMVQVAQTMVLQAKNWALSSSLDESSLFLGHHRRHHGGGGGGHSGLSFDDNTDKSSLFFGRRSRGKSGGHHGGGGGSGGHHGGGLYNMSNHDSTVNNYTSYNIYSNNDSNNITKDYNQIRMAMFDCAKLYDLAEPRLARLLKKDGKYCHEDAVAWLSGAITSHRTCLDGLREKGVDDEVQVPPMSQNLTFVLNEALALHAKKQRFGVKPKGVQGRPKDKPFVGRLASRRADIVVARDGSGKYRTIKEAVDAIGRIQGRGDRRVVVYVKAGVYDERVVIPRHLRNVMFVGDGIGKTVVTGSRNVVDGATTVNSATFQVWGDEFWARDMTFENTAGPQKHQAVALMVASDHSLFYRCSFRGYQDTLYVHSLRQFYRDCHIYGTVDFIFGNAAVVLQNCDIFVRKPMKHRAVITAQGRENPNENTGISIHGSRLRPAPELKGLKQSVSTFLGRPWKKYSRTVVSTTDLDGLIHPRGWTNWEGNFAFSTLYYAEYMNTGDGASTRDRVNWPGFHLLRNPKEVNPFMVRNFIQGESWITRTGVPVWLEM